MGIAEGVDELAGRLLEAEEAEDGEDEEEDEAEAGEADEAGVPMDEDAALELAALEVGSSFRSMTLAMSKFLDREAAAGAPTDEDAAMEPAALEARDFSLSRRK